ncbi:MAG: serine--tRNA ligase, partial [Bacteroidota bacterium]|nr:serine--tRNA ligase [Bacteroidota bacterium]
MLTLKVIQENPEKVIERLAVKNFDAKETVYKILDIDKERRDLQKNMDQQQAELNALSKEIGNLFKSGKKEEAAAAKDKTAGLKDSVKELSQKLDSKEKELNELLVLLPNMPSEVVPKGKSAADNVVVKKGGIIPELPEDALPHWDLAKKYDIIDFELGNKLTGAGFPVYKGKGARLQRALINFF